MHDLTLSSGWRSRPPRVLASEQLDHTASYVDRYFAELPALARRRSGLVLERLAAAAYPQYAVRHTRSTRRRHAVPDLDPTIRRAVTDADDDVRRALAARTAADPMGSTIRVGIIGGTFDPIHHGHLVAASRWPTGSRLMVVFAPTGQPWQKEGVAVTPAEDRYLMTVIATASNPRFQTSRVDVDRVSPTLHHRHAARRACGVR
jgi:hypothetical protein